MSDIENLFVLLVGLSAMALVLAIGGAVQDLIAIIRHRRNRARRTRMARLRERLKRQAYY